MAGLHHRRSAGAIEATQRSTGSSAPRSYLPAPALLTRSPRWRITSSPSQALAAPTSCCSRAGSLQACSAIRKADSAVVGVQLPQRPHAPGDAHWPHMVFTHVTVTMVLVYASLVLFTKSKAAEWLARGPYVVGALAVTYLACLALAVQAGAHELVLDVLRGLTVPPHVPDVHAVGALFHSPMVTVVAWCHLLLLDFYQAREIWLDGLVSKVPVAHSIALSFFMGPVGLLSHTLTSWLVRRNRSSP